MSKILRLSRASVAKQAGLSPSRSPTSLCHDMAQIFISGACLYKGQVYQQGQTWQDGCDYECECTDANRGMYKCTER